MTAHWKAILGVILIFIFGFCSGMVCTSIFIQRKALAILQHPAVAATTALENRLTGNLDLDANQKQQIHEYFAENLDHRRQAQTQIQPQIQILNRKTFQQINAILRPDQSERFHQNLAEFRKRYAKYGLSINMGAPNQSDSPATNSSAGAPPPAR